MAENKNLNEPQELSNDELAGVSGGRWTYLDEVEFSSKFNHARKDGTTSATTFEEYVEELGRTSERQAWLKATNGFFPTV